jgi:hypothetical protein
MTYSQLFDIKFLYILIELVNIYTLDKSSLSTLK